MGSKSYVRNRIIAGMIAVPLFIAGVYGLAVIITSVEVTAINAMVAYMIRDSFDPALESITYQLVNGDIAPADFGGHQTSIWQWKLVTRPTELGWFVGALCGAMMALGAEIVLMRTRIGIALRPIVVR